MFGQPRTFNYCTPWIKKVYENLEVDYFVGLRTYNTGFNIIGDNHLEQAITYYDLNSMVHAFKPKSYGYMDSSFEDCIGIKGNPNHAMLLVHSMAFALNLKQKQEKAEGFKYDICVFQRTDTLTGPEIDSFERFVAATEFDPFTVYTADPGIIFSDDMEQTGLQDLFMFGSNLAMDLFVAEMSDIWNVSDTDKMDDYHYNTHILMLEAIQNCSLRAGTYDGDSAIVRPNSDLTIPVFESFASHIEFASKIHIHNEKP